MKIKVLLGEQYPAVIDYLEVETDEIVSYDVKIVSIRDINDETRDSINNSKNAFKLSIGFSNEETALNWLKEYGVYMKLRPVCALSFMYKSKEYTAIYVPGMDSIEDETMDMNELVIGNSFFCNSTKFIRVNPIYPAVGKSFLDLFIKAGITNKESIENMFMYGTTGNSCDNNTEFSITLPTDGSKLGSVINQKTIIKESTVLDVKYSCKDILYINLGNDRLRLMGEVDKWDTFKMSQIEIIEKLSSLDYVKEIKLEKISIRTKEYCIEAISYKPIGDETGIFWIYLNNDEIKYEGVRPYDGRFKDMKQMYEVINKNSEEK